MANSGDVIVINNGKLTKTATGSSHVATVAGSLTVTENLTVNGTTVTLNTATLDVQDKNITLNQGSGDTSGSADGAGITIQDAVDASTDASILWDATNDEFDFSHTVNVAGNLIVSGSIDGIADLASTVAANTAKVTNATHTGDVTGSTALTIANDAVTYAKIQNVSSNNVLLGNDDGANSAVQELTAAEVRAILNVADGAQVNVPTNLSQTTAASQLTISSSTGTDIVVAEATGTIAGLMSTAHHDKLDGIEAGATADQTAGEIRTLLGTGNSGVVPSAGNAGEFLAANGAFAVPSYSTKQSLDVDHLINLSGVSAESDNLGTFPGNVIPDSSTVKSALESLEQEVERSSVQNTLTATEGQFINEFFSPAEKIQPGKILYPAGNRTLGIAASNNAAKDAVVGMSLDNAQPNAELEIAVMGNHSSIQNDQTLEFNVSKNGSATLHYYRLVAKTSGSNSTSWSGTGADSGNPYIWNIVINASGENNTNVAGHIKTALEHSSGGLDTNFSAGDVGDVTLSGGGTGKGFSLTADTAGKEYNFEVTSNEWQTSSNQMEAQITAFDAAQVKMAIPGSSVVGFNFSSGYVVGQELYLDSTGNPSSSVPGSGAVIRVGYVMSIDNPSGGDTMLFSPQFIMDN